MQNISQKGKRNKKSNTNRTKINIIKKQKGIKAETEVKLKPCEELWVIILRTLLIS